MNMNEEHITDLIQKLVEQIENNQHEHIIQELDLQLEQSGIVNVPTLSILECHVIAYIGDNNVTNAISVANNLNITRGGISKIMSRLIKKGLMEASQLAGNKREVFYRLTSLGKKVYCIHDTLHKKHNVMLKSMVNLYSKEEKLTIERFLNDLIKNI